MFTSYLIHPMIVHFPIVLFLTVPVLDAWIIARGGDLAARTCLPNVALAALLAGLATGLAAIMFGYIAAVHAEMRGFPSTPIEWHERLAMTTVAVFAVAAALRMNARRQNIALSGVRGWLFFLITVTGAMLLLVTAYLGGHLVYGLGVNIPAAGP